MKSKGGRSIRGRFLAVAAAAGAFAVAAPVSGAGAQITPAGYPVGGGGPNTQGCAGGPNVGSGSQVGGPGGSTTQLACGAVLAFIGPSVGSVNSVIGPTIIGATIMAPVTVSSGGPVVNSVP